MSEARGKIPKTSSIDNPTYYVEALKTEFVEYAYDEERAKEFKGQWRSKIFKIDESVPLDLEIGTGNGYFFAHHAHQNQHRGFIGIEIKFKPLIQSIRRALRDGAKNARIVRYNASFVHELFVDKELDNVYIHHPDPWTKRRRYKHRLLNRNFLSRIFLLQKYGCFIDFKTDSEDYFRWAVEEFKHSEYVIERYSENLHQSEWAAENFTTHFERLFLKQNLPIYYLRAFKREKIYSN